MMNTLISFLVFLLLVYVGFGAYLFFNQTNLVYHPNNQDFASCQGFLDYQKITHQSTRMYYKEQSTSEVIVYYHGNAGSACDRSQHKKHFEKTNASLIYVEYAGFSNDTQKPSVSNILTNVDDTADFIKQQGFTKVTIVGKSLGSGPASYHANTNDIDHLLLIAPFTSIIDVAKEQYWFFPLKLLIRENYDNVKWLSSYTKKLTIIHGTNDKTIAFSMGKKLFDSVSTNKTFVEVQTGHNDMWQSDAFIQALESSLI